MPFMIVYLNYLCIINWHHGFPCGNPFSLRKYDYFVHAGLTVHLNGMTSVKVQSSRPNRLKLNFFEFYAVHKMSEWCVLQMYREVHLEKYEMTWNTDILRYKASNGFSSRNSGQVYFLRVHLPSFLKWTKISFCVYVIRA